MLIIIYTKKPELYNYKKEHYCLILIFLPIERSCPMKLVKRSLSLILALVLILSASAFIFAEEGEETKRIYMKPDGLSAGDYYFDLSESIFDYDWFYNSRYMTGRYYGGMSDEEAEAYAADMAPKDVEAFLNAEWSIGKESLRLYADFHGHDFTNIFEVYYYQTNMLEMLREVGLESMEWDPVAMPEHADDEFAHGQYYYDLNTLYDHFFQEEYAFYQDHPEYTEGKTEEEIAQMCHDSVMSTYIDPTRASEYFIRPDDPLFRVKRVATNDEGTFVMYYPYEIMQGMGGIFGFDESEYVVEYHDYYRCVWQWQDEDHAIANIICYLGEHDGTGDVHREVITDIEKVVVREATELRDGELQCTAHISFRGVESTDTHTFVIPATGDPERLTITSQPVDRTVSYPDGASFAITVDKPELVSSYQWIMTDGVRNYTLTGITASTPELKVNSTEELDSDLSYYCIVTDINGNVVTSDQATLYINNRDEIKTVLYVGDYGLEPGDTLDLSTTTLGSGVVTFDPDGLNITFDNVTVNTAGLSKDMIFTASAGVFLVGQPDSSLEYKMYFKGTCTFNNSVYDPDYDGGGVTINAHFLRDGKLDKPLLIIDGDDDLNINGGLNSIYTDGDLEILTSFKAVPFDGHRLNSISASNVHIGDGAHVDITGIGTGILSNGTLFINGGAVIDLNITAPHLILYNTESKGIYCDRLYVDGAKLNIDMMAYPEYFEPYEKSISVMSAICCRNIATFDGADVNIKLGAELGDTYYANNFYGISGDASDGINEVELINGAKVKIDIDTKGAYGGRGIAATGQEPCAFVTLSDGSELDVNVKTSGHVFGIDVGQPVSVTDSTLRVNAASYDTAIVMGVMCPVMNVELTDSKYEVSLNAEKGIGLFATEPRFTEGGQTGPTALEKNAVSPAAYEEGYEPKLIRIAGDAKILAPENGEINSYDFEHMGVVMPGESIYAADNTEEPAAKVLIAVPKPPAPPTGDDLLLWAALMAIMLTASVVLIIDRRPNTGKHYR